MLNGARFLRQLVRKSHQIKLGKTMTQKNRQQPEPKRYVTYYERFEPVTPSRRNT